MNRLRLPVSVCVALLIAHFVFGVPITIGIVISAIIGGLLAELYYTVRRAC